jgi:hypothetical protein
MSEAQTATLTVEPPSAPKAAAYEAHPLADIFPKMTGSELGVLAVDIKNNGLRQKITLHDGKILDGRNRYRACEIAKVRPAFEEFTGGDPLAFVISANLHRRHLNETQRGIVAAKLANMRVGGREANPSKDGIPPTSQETAAKLLNVSTKTVERATKLIKGGVPDLVAAAEQGRVKVSKAVAFVDKPESERQLLISKSGDVVKAARHLDKGGGGSETYDNVEKKLIAQLEKMNAETAEAAAQKTIKALGAMVKAKKGGKHSLKIAA